VTPTTPSAADPPTVLARCAAVSRTFRRGGVEVPAVRKVDCTVTVGMRIALTGPSGSGKSTLLHMLAGLDRPTAGTISWPGLGGSPRERPGLVGVVFQGPSLIPALDVRENVALPLLLAGVRETEAVERAAAALDGLALGALAAALPEELSGGQAQRVAIARVLAGRPALVLADEPTGTLDEGTADIVFAEFLRLVRDEGSAALVATHNERIAAKMDRVLRLHEGVLE